MEHKKKGFDAAKKNDPTMQAWLANFTSKDDAETLFWTGNAWMSKTNVIKEDPAAVAELFVGVAMVERAVKLDDGVANGSGHMTLGAYHARSPMAELADAKVEFDKAITITQGKGLMAKFQLASKYYCIKGDKDAYMKTLTDVVQAGDVWPEPASHQHDREAPRPTLSPEAAPPRLRFLKGYVARDERGRGSLTWRGGQERQAGQGQEGPRRRQERGERRGQRRGGASAERAARGRAGERRESEREPPRRALAGDELHGLRPRRSTRPASRSPRWSQRPAPLGPRRLHRLDEQWTKLESRLLVWVLFAELLSLTAWVLLNDSTDDKSFDGALFRALVGAIVVGTGGWLASKARSKNARTWIAIGAAVAGAFVGILVVRSASLTSTT